MTPSESPSVTICRRRRLGLAGRDGVRTVVLMRGEHDASTVAELSAAMAAAIMLDDKDVVVDSSRTPFMGEATIGVINRARELLGAQSRWLVLRPPSRCADLVNAGRLTATRVSSVGADYRADHVTTDVAARGAP